MDPVALTNSEWTELGNLLTNLWFELALISSFAGNMIVGHIAIPSLVASHHAPEVFEKTRPIFYVLAILSFAVAVFVMVVIIGQAEVIERIYDDYWI